MAHHDVNRYSWQRYRIENQNTQPLPTGNLPFRFYLSAHHLTSLAAARLADVPYAITWNIEQNKPIRSKTANVVRVALLRATGVAYTGPIVVHPQPEQTQNGSDVRG
jgi:hypothetical protein